jgi:hypothetical protein
MIINWKLITYITIVVMVICLFVIGFYYYNNVVNKCTSNPLVYASQKYTKQYGYNFTGYGWFNTPIGVLSPQVTFDSNNVTIK